MGLYWSSEAHPEFSLEGRVAGADAEAI